MRRPLEHGRAALLPQDPGVDVALDGGVDEAVCPREVVGCRGKSFLLGKDERVRGRVEPVVGKKPQHERAADALVGHGEVLDAAAEGLERPAAVRLVHLVAEPVVGDRPRGPPEGAREQRVGPLVAQQEGEQLLLADDHALGQRRRGVLAEDVVADDGGHAGASSRRVCTPALYPPDARRSCRWAGRARRRCARFFVTPRRRDRARTLSYRSAV